MFAGTVGAMIFGVMCGLFLMLVAGRFLTGGSKWGPPSWKMFRDHPEQY